MPPARAPSGPPDTRALAKRLRERRDEIEEQIAARVFALGEEVPADPTYLDGLRNAVTDALDYCLAVLENDPQAAEPPDALLMQTRLAARHGVPLDVVLRRYMAGYALFADFAISDAEDGDLLRREDLRAVLRLGAQVLDRLIHAVSEEHGRESLRRGRSPSQRHAELIRRLLDGEMVDATMLGYSFDAWHVGVAACGSDAAEAIRQVARELDRQVLWLSDSDEPLQAWLGGRVRTPPDEMQKRLAARLAAGGALALGHPARDLSGWRLTYHQARAALPVAMRSQTRTVSYPQVALLAAASHDRLLAASLEQIYLEPLRRQRDADSLQKTLRIYFERSRNLSSTAAALGISRRTVANRLRRVEVLLGQPLATPSTGLAVALAHDALNED